MLRVVFFGTPPFAAQVLDYLFKQGVHIVAVVSKPDRPKGRSGTPVPTPVKITALSYDPYFPVYQPEKVSDLAFAPILKNYEADLFAVVAYGEILKSHLLEMPRQACINLHASLLPRYRGAAPIQRCLMAGDKESGVTIMHMVKKMDAGDMLERVAVPIGPDTTAGELEQTLCHVGKEALLRVIQSFEKGKPLSTPQDESQVTFAPKIELEDCEIKWDRSAQELHNLVRGVHPHPGAWCYISLKGERKRLKINRTRLVLYEKQAPGIVLNREATKGNLLVAAGENALELVEVQLEGKKSMSSEELCRGFSRQYFQFL